MPHFAFLYYFSIFSNFYSIFFKLPGNYPKLPKFFQITRKLPKFLSTQKLPKAFQITRNLGNYPEIGNTENDSVFVGLFGKFPALWCSTGDTLIPANFDPWPLSNTSQWIGLTTVTSSDETTSMPLANLNCYLNVHWSTEFPGYTSV